MDQEEHQREMQPAFRATPRMLRLHAVPQSEVISALLSSAASQLEDLAELQEKANAVFNAFIDFDEYGARANTFRELHDAIMAMGELLPGRGE